MNSPMHPSAAWQDVFTVRFNRRFGRWSACIALALLPLVPQTSGADFSVTTPGNSYTINLTPGSPGPLGSPTLTLVRGETYTFAINTGSFHPFRINSTGVLNNNIGSGTITWIVPLETSNYTYQCSIHGFGGPIITVPKPTVRIVNFAVSTSVVLLSTGTTNYTVIPEFNTNAASTNWFALTVQTNRFLLGTNETICGLPPDSNVFIRVRAQRR